MENESNIGNFIKNNLQYFLEQNMGVKLTEDAECENKDQTKQSSPSTKDN